MSALDIYLFSLTDEEYAAISLGLESAQKSLPLLSWDITTVGFDKHQENIKNGDLKKLSVLAIKHLWNIDLEDFLSSDYESIVLTDIDNKICWTSKGFIDMTGYSSKYALGRNPNFLQGKNTSTKTRQIIKEHLQQAKPFKGSIINYRRNGEEYLCEVNIIPLFNYNNKLTHFIALEREAV
nr:PAS domain-containing protein [Flavobacterium sp. Sd200]